MMMFVEIFILLIVAITGTTLVLTKDPKSQVIGLSFYGLILGVMFFVFQAPDVALSQITIGAVALPLMFMLALAKIRRNQEQRRSIERCKQSGENAA